MEKIRVRLTALENSAHGTGFPHGANPLMEFHIDSEVRKQYGIESSLFALSGNVVLADMRKTRELAAKFNAKNRDSRRFIRAGELYAMGLIDEILHYVVALYRKQVQPEVFETGLERLHSHLGGEKTEGLLTSFSRQFPPKPVYTGEKEIAEYLQGSDGGCSCRCISLEETLLLSLANMNPAFTPFRFLFDDRGLARKTVYTAAIEELKAHFKKLPAFGPDALDLWEMLRAPALASDTLAGQLEYMRRHWGLIITEKFMSRLLVGVDTIKEEEKPGFAGPGPSQVMSFAGMDEYERFSPDQDWMPRTVLMAKSTLVWLFQLSRKYGREITRLDQIPDEEIDELSRRGFTGLWLIGLWQRSSASKTIKQWTGNPEAAASAYSLYDYDVAAELGGWDALGNLRERCIRRGIRLGSDMVPNHTGIDSRWMAEYPGRFLQLPYPPFPTYNYNCANLSGRDDITVQIEEHYFDRSDAAVVFKRIDNRSGETRYIYHGNDGTAMPWNDTAQIDFLNPEAREAVIRTIVGVCQQFPIVRFDAAMTLAKRHIQRLWFPVPGSGGAISSRGEHAISNDEFNARIPNEFWREVVDRCAAEAPHTLLLAEAFWMMEGYFVRTLGMHRVYNSAFMNMLKNEENAKYRATIKNTLEFDPEILKRFVNFMNNPDEDTAVAQFGKDDKYFGICTLLVTMPGLPMFGHGQIEGYEEKYGMEYRRSYKDEQPDGYLVDRHEREIFPLARRRSLFSGSTDFRLYDLYTDGGVNENVFAYSNRCGSAGHEERALVFYNNSYADTAGWIKTSDPAIPQSDGSKQRDSLSRALALHGDERHFTLLRDQRSGLWYIRSSKAILENGFFVSLKGYEAQVFIDIYEVADDEKGRWARLDNDMHGRGMEDPHWAIMDIYLGDLYYRFTQIIQRQTVERLQGILASGKTDGPETDAFTESLRETAQNYFDTARYFISGADGKAEPWEAADSGEEDGKNKADGKNQKDAAGNDDLWKEFAAYTERLFSAYAKTDRKAAGGIAKEITENPAVCAAVLGYGFLSILRFLIDKKGAAGDLAAGLAFDHWGLGRKFADSLKLLGVSDSEAGHIAEVGKAVLRRTGADGNCIPDCTGTAGSSENPAAAFAGKNSTQDDFLRLIGANDFNDITWFNKEAFEKTLFYGRLFFLTESRSEKQAKLVCKTADALEKAKDASGYKLDELLRLLNGKTAEKKAGAGEKAAGKKTGRTKKSR